MAISVQKRKLMHFVKITYQHYYDLALLDSAHKRGYVDEGKRQCSIPESSATRPILHSDSLTVSTHPKNYEVKVENEDVINEESSQPHTSHDPDFKAKDCEPHTESIVISDLIRDLDSSKKKVALLGSKLNATEIH